MRVRTGFGGHVRPRPTFVCDKCQRPATKLRNRHNSLACRHCHHAIPLSQKLDKVRRPILKAHRLEQFLALKTNAQKHTRDRLIKRYGEKAMMPVSNYKTRGAMHWK
jgi:hypothetical protein